MKNSHLDRELSSFYHLPGGDIDGRSCRGMACFVARNLNQDRWRQAVSEDARVYCLGKCYAAPASANEVQRPEISVQSAESIVLKRIVNGAARRLGEYERYGRYRALEKALVRPPNDIIAAVEASGLRGRGGAGFPSGKKWRAVSRELSPEKFVVANADEGDPGAFIDRFIVEDDPHSLVEALAIAAYAVGASRGYVYLRCEYPEAARSLRAAIDEARDANLLGNRILAKEFTFDIEIVIGRGSYVCGEETALLNSIEGRRPEVRARPPYPTTSGLFNRPTLVNNVETLANIPWIIDRGPDAFHRLGFSNSRGTKVLSLNSLFNRPGLHEVEFGKRIGEIVFETGGGLKTGDVRGVLIGGPLAGIIPPPLFDTPLAFEELHEIGASVGHGGVIAFDSHTSIAELMHHVFSFGAYESCGKCTPCRLGSRQVELIFDQVIKDGVTPNSNLSELSELIAALRMTSLCGHGTGLAEFAASIQRYYREELERCFA
jgi:formate dehydrogenase iron-sulfur subunit